MQPTKQMAQRIPETRPMVNPFQQRPILPENIRNACKNADELESAFSLYKNISPYIAFNKDGEPTKVGNPLNELNAPSQGGITRLQDLKLRFGAFLIDYSAIYDDNTRDRFIAQEITDRGLEQSEVESFVRIRKAVHGEVKKEFEKVYFPIRVEQRIKTKMQERKAENLEIQQLELEIQQIERKIQQIKRALNLHYEPETPRFGSSYLMTFGEKEDKNHGTFGPKINMTSTPQPPQCLKVWIR